MTVFSRKQLDFLRQRGVLRSYPLAILEMRFLEILSDYDSKQAWRTFISEFLDLLSPEDTQRAMFLSEDGSISIITVTPPAVCVKESSHDSSVDYQRAMVKPVFSDSVLNKYGLRSVPDLNAEEIGWLVEVMSRFVKDLKIITDAEKKALKRCLKFYQKFTMYVEDDVFCREAALESCDSAEMTEKYKQIVNESKRIMASYQCASESSGGRRRIPLHVLKEAKQIVAERLSHPDAPPLRFQTSAPDVPPGRCVGRQSFFDEVVEEEQRIPAVFLERDGDGPQYPQRHDDPFFGAPPPQRSSPNPHSQGALCYDDPFLATSSPQPAPPQPSPYIESLIDDCIVDRKDEEWVDWNEIGEEEERRVEDLVEEEEDEQVEERRDAYAGSNDQTTAASSQRKEESLDEETLGRAAALVCGEVLLAFRGARMKGEETPTDELVVKRVGPIVRCPHCGGRHSLFYMDMCRRKKGEMGV